MKNKIWILATAIMVLITVISGCTSGSSDKNDMYMHTYRVYLYYANSEYVETGDEEIPKMCDAMEVKIRSTPENIYADMVSYLKQEPSDTRYVTMLPPELVINSVEVNNGTAIVDFSSVGLNGGSMQEMFMINQIVNSLLESFQEIDRVQFTVDGNVAETLMGHVMIQDPFTWQEN